VVVGVSSSELLPATGVRVVFLDEAGAKQSGALEVLWGTGFEHVSPVRSFGSFRVSGVFRVRSGSGLGRKTPLNDPGVRLTHFVTIPLLSASGCVVALCDGCPRAVRAAFLAFPACVPRRSPCLPGFGVSASPWSPRLAGLEASWSFVVQCEKVGRHYGLLGDE
jgi:hypothetical protein